MRWAKGEVARHGRKTRAADEQTRRREGVDRPIYRGTVPGQEGAWIAVGNAEEVGDAPGLGRGKGQADSGLKDLAIDDRRTACAWDDVDPGFDFGLEPRRTRAIVVN
jgi:hypothetical protein